MAKHPPIQPTPKPAEVQLELPGVEPKATEPEPKPRTFTVTPVYGPMVHLIKNVRIDGPTEFDEVDFWLQAQIDSGKVLVCP